MTLPFFGSGVVELPPEGFKRAKNSRKMQMCFFVHEGKVMVEVGAANGRESNEFAVSKGGAWVVPRGESASFSFCCVFAALLPCWIHQNPGALDMHRLLNSSGSGPAPAFAYRSK